MNHPVSIILPDAPGIVVVLLFVAVKLSVRGICLHFLNI